jgi:hypothetical protein
VVLPTQAQAGERPKRFKSPDGRLTAIVMPVETRDRSGGDESRISILLGASKKLRAYDFLSDDGDHGYAVDGAQWTPDSQFFVCLMRSSGGHSPMYAPVVFWIRRTNRFYQLNDYTADTDFLIAAPDKVTVNTWPGLEAATISLHSLKQEQATELR